MTTTPAPSITTYPLTGSAQGPFTTVWRYADAGDVVVSLERGGVEGGALTLATDYTLTAADPLVSGGTVMLAPSTVPSGDWTDGDRVILRRRTPRRQAVALPDTEGHKPRATERALDKAMRIAEEDRDHVARAIVLPVGEDGLALPSAAERVRKVMVGDETGALIFRDQGEFRGPPGGNVMSVGPFTALAGLAVPEGVDRIITDSYDGSVPGRGAAAYAVVDAGPATRYRAQAADGRWFEIAETYPTVQQFGARGEPGFDDTPAFNAAFALGVPMGVPATGGFYALTALFPANQDLLYGLGVVKVLGTAVEISSAASIPDPAMAAMRVVRRFMAPMQHPGVTGSVGRSGGYLEGTRTAGYGAYGNLLITSLVTALLRPNEFDCGLTSWITTQKLQHAASQVFGGWDAANSPSSSLGGQVFTAGAVVGREINYGNRFADFGQQLTLGAAGRYTVGLQLVPDVGPALDGPTSAIYPGTFARATAPSIHGHRTWTGDLTSYDAIMPGGLARNTLGGSAAISSPRAIERIAGYFVDGLDFTDAVFSGAVLKFNSVAHGQVSGSATAGGGASVPGTVAGFIIIQVDGVSKRIPYFGA